jgi:hypothetical protein
MLAIVIPTSASGQPGDFHFLSGEWTIHNTFLENTRPESALWIEFPGEATVVGLLNGAASIEELRIPARDFSGIGIRLLDVATGLWSDHWVNAKSGVLSLPGQTGTFVDGVGTFASAPVDGVMYRGVWDRITATSCRWHQGHSHDGGATWTDSWFMDWTRA